MAPIMKETMSKGRRTDKVFYCKGFENSGIYYWADKSTYNGNWTDNKINGKVPRESFYNIVGKVYMERWPCL